MQTNWQQSLIRLLLCILLIPQSVFGDNYYDEVSETERAKAQLARMTVVLLEIENYIERPDLARLYVMKKNVQLTTTALNEKGLAHSSTFRAYQQQIISFRYSIAYFRMIHTDVTAAQIEELWKIHETIINERGFDLSPYTEITLNVFSQMHKLILQLRSLGELPEELKAPVIGLIPAIANVMAIATQGDRPKTFEAASPMVQEFRALYPLFEKIMATQSAFELIMELRGLNEFYGEYAQVEHD